MSVELGSSNLGQKKMIKKQQIDNVNKFRMYLGTGKRPASKALESWKTMLIFSCRKACDVQDSKADLYRPRRKFLSHTSTVGLDTQFPVPVPTFLQVTVPVPLVKKLRFRLHNTGIQIG
jgi:hypothetical protein